MLVIFILNRNDCSFLSILNKCMFLMINDKTFMFLFLNINEHESNG